MFEYIAWVSEYNLWRKYTAGLKSYLLKKTITMQ